MAQGGKNDGGMELDDPMVVGFIIMGLYVVWLVIWAVFIEHISIGHVYYRYATSYPVYLISSFFPDTPGLSYPYKFIQHWCAPEPGLFGKCTVDFTKLTKEDNYNIALPYNIFFLMVLFGFCIKIFLKVSKIHPESKFNKIHNLNSFMKEQSVNYEHLNVFNNIDLIEKSISDPLYGMSLNAKQFAYRYQLVKDWGRDANGTDYVPYLDRAKTEAIFSKQLGNAFSGWNKTTPAQKMILSIIIPLCAATRPGMPTDEFEAAINDSRNMIKAAWSQFKYGECGLSEEEVKAMPEDKLDDLWLTEPEIDLPIFEKVISTYSTSDEVKSILYTHAYTTTVIYEMLIQARRLGVLQPAEMRWLRFFDRPMWYFINSIGRRSPFPEAAGIHSHFLAEKTAGESYVQPMVTPAVNALSDQIQKYKYSQPALFLPEDEPASWDSTSEKDILKLYPNLPISVK